MTTANVAYRWPITRTLLPKPAFAWDFRQSLLTPTRGAGTFAVTRAGNTAWRVNSAGEYELVNANLPRFSLGADGVMRLLVEGSSINDCVQSQNFGATWVAVGTPTRSAAAKTAGVLALDLLGDDDATALEGYTLASGAVTPGNNVKGFSFHIAQGTSTSTAFRVRDTTASANRVLGVVTWQTGVPVVTMTTGSHLLTESQFANGIFRIHVLSATVTAANNHSLEFYPASDAALSVGGTGTVYLGGVQWEALNIVNPPTSYILTAGAAVTRNTDLVQVNPFTMPAAGTIVCRARTAALDGTLDSTARRLFSASDGTNNESISAVRNASSRILQASISDGGVGQIDVGTTEVNANARVAIAMSYATNNVAWSVNGGAVQVDTTATMPTVDRLLLGVIAAGTSNFWSEGIESLSIHNTRLPNSMLPQLCFASV